MKFNKEYLENLVNSQEEESQQLEYKGGDGLSNDKTTEITKDISAMANANGGVIIYGMRESEQANAPGKALKIEPIKDLKVNREWLDQKIGRIDPPIPGFKIHPIHVGPGNDDYCYVVEVPKGETAHQALTKKYHRRRNFTTDELSDFEIRDLMNRRKHPKLTAEVRLPSNNPRYLNFEMRVHNIGKIMARFLMVQVQMPQRVRSDKLTARNIGSTRADNNFTFSFLNDYPLFPGSAQSFATGISLEELDPLEEVVPVEEIMITIYADDMEKIHLAKNFDAALEDWT